MKKTTLPKATETRKGLPVIALASRRQWQAWLAREHADSPGIWIALAKKGSGVVSVSYDEAVEIALCYGWIDSQSAGLDAQRWLQRFTPRKPRSKWSKINCAKALELIERGEMTPAGLREIDRAKADGRWAAAYEAQSQAKVPDDLQRALNRDRAAKDFFAKLDSRNRYAILHRIHDAKKPETRARRIAKFVDMLGKGQRIY